MNRDRLIPRLRRTGAPLLDFRARVYLLALLGPLFVYSLSLKLVRIADRPGDAGPLATLQLLRSDILFDLGYALVWAGLFIVAKSGIPRRSVTVAFHVVTILAALVSTAAHFYYVETGSTLSLHFISYYLSSPGEIQSVLASKVSAGAALTLLPLTYTVFGPWLLARTLERGGVSRVSWGGRRTARGSWLGLVGALLAASGLFLFSMRADPEATGASASFIRAPLVSLVSEEIDESAYEDEVQVNEAKVRENLPRDTSLSTTPRTDKRNVVLIQLESTRARSVTPYNERLQTTPYLDSLAGKSLVAENAYTTVPHTSNSITAINCGIEPPTTPRGTDSLAEDVPARCLPKLLAGQGYDTAFFQSATENFESRRKVVENFGYEDFFPLESMEKQGFERANYFSYEDDIMLEPSRNWLAENQRQNPQKPFLATYLTGTAHDDYGVPSRYGMKDFSEDPLLNRYQNTVRYQDFFVRNLIQQYKDMGLYEDTVFVITGDHGEAFGEHGRFQHDKVPYEEGVKIPMMIHDPKRQGWTAGGASVDGLANQLDLLPSITALLGYRVEGGKYPGRPLWNLPQNGTVNFSCWGSRDCLASRKGDLKYVYNYGDRPDELYDLSRDPLEKNNLLSDASRADRSEADDRRQRLLTWWAEVQAMYRD